MKGARITDADMGIADSRGHGSKNDDAEQASIADIIAQNWDCRRYIEACRAHTMTKQETTRFWGRASYYRRRYNPPA